MSISKYCIDDVVREKINNMDDRYFTNCMMSEREVINTLNSTIIVESSRRNDYDTEIYEISENYNNGIWTYHLKKTLKEKVRLSNTWINFKNENIKHEYNQQVINFVDKFKRELNNINKWKINKYVSYKQDLKRCAKRKIKRHYFKLKYITYRYTIMNELLKRV